MPQLRKIGIQAMLQLGKIFLSQLTLPQQPMKCTIICTIRQDPKMVCTHGIRWGRHIIDHVVSMKDIAHVVSMLWHPTIVWRPLRM